jgi:HSP20 family protein
MATWTSVAIAPEVGAELVDELRRLFDELDSESPRPLAASSGECSPGIDVLETDESVEIVMDLPGVPLARLRILAKGDLVVIAGDKPSLPPPVEAPGTYHLLERSFGRFARAVRITRAVDGAAARASLVGGELRVLLPKIHERRGRTRTIPIDDTPLPRDC